MNKVEVQQPSTRVARLNACRLALGSILTQLWAKMKAVNFEVSGQANKQPSSPKMKQNGLCGSKTFTDRQWVHLDCGAVVAPSRSIHTCCLPVAGRVLQCKSCSTFVYNYEQDAFTSKKVSASPFSCLQQGALA
jgi:hypothetical protein